MVNTRQARKVDYGELDDDDEDFADGEYDPPPKASRKRGRPSSRDAIAFKGSRKLGASGVGLKTAARAKSSTLTKRRGRPPGKASPLAVPLHAATASRRGVGASSMRGLSRGDGPLAAVANGGTAGVAAAAGANGRRITGHGAAPRAPGRSGVVIAPRASVKSEDDDDDVAGAFPTARTLRSSARGGTLRVSYAEGDEDEEGDEVEEEQGVNEEGGDAEEGEEQDDEGDEGMDEGAVAPADEGDVESGASGSDDDVEDEQLEEPGRGGGRYPLRKPHKRLKVEDRQTAGRADLQRRDGGRDSRRDGASRGRVKWGKGRPKSVASRKKAAGGTGGGTSAWPLPRRVTRGSMMLEDVAAKQVDGEDDDGGEEEGEEEEEVEEEEADAAEEGVEDREADENDDDGGEAQDGEEGDEGEAGEDDEEEEEEEEEGNAGQAGGSRARAPLRRKYVLRDRSRMVPPSLQHKRQQQQQRLQHEALKRNRRRMRGGGGGTFGSAAAAAAGGGRACDSGWRGMDDVMDTEDQQGGWEALLQPPLGAPGGYLGAGGALGGGLPSWQSNPLLPSTPHLQVPSAAPFGTQLLPGGGSGLLPGSAARPWDAAAGLGGGGGGAGISGSGGGEHGKEKSAGAAEITAMQVDMSITLDQVGGLDHYLRALKEMVFLPLVYPEIFERFRVAPPRGVLFYGPPGTGKTLVARALAAQAARAGRKVAFFMRKGADVLSKWVGEAERQLRLLFAEAARCQPSIIFFDEIDGLAPVRSSKQDQIHNSIVSTLLALMDGLDPRGQVVIIGATNRIDSLDGALRRPGRFDRELLFPLPGLQARGSILDIHTRRWSEPPPRALRDELAAACVGYCGADLKALCAEAALHALRRTYPQIYASDEKLLVPTTSVRVTRDDFMAAKAAITPAAHRAAAAHARPLSPVVAPCLSGPLGQALTLLTTAFPPTRHCLASTSNPNSTPALHRSTFTAGSSTGSAAAVLLSLLPARMVLRPRLLLCGPPGAGQDHLGPAVLHMLEALPVHSVGLPELLSDPGSRSPDEALVHAFLEAKRAAPSILYLPHLQLWWQTAPSTLRATLRVLLADLPPDLPLLLLATAGCPADELEDDGAALFGGSGQRLQLGPPRLAERREMFKELVLVAAPQSTLASDGQAAEDDTAPAPELMVDQSTVRARELEEEQRREMQARMLYEDDQAALRALRMALRDITLQLLVDRRWKLFAEPVAPEQDLSYWERVSQPMDIATLLSRVDQRRYATPKAYLADVGLLVQCAREYFGAGVAGAREVSRAEALVDLANSMVAARVPTALAARCEAIQAKGEPAPAPASVLALDKAAADSVAAAAAAAQAAMAQRNAAAAPPAAPRPPGGPGTAGPSGTGGTAGGGGGTLRGSARLRGELDNVQMLDNPEALTRQSRGALAASRQSLLQQAGQQTGGGGSPAKDGSRASLPTTNGIPDQQQQQHGTFDLQRGEEQQQQQGVSPLRPLQPSAPLPATASDASPTAAGKRLGRQTVAEAAAAAAAATAASPRGAGPSCASAMDIDDLSATAALDAATAAAAGITGGSRDREDGGTMYRRDVGGTAPGNASAAHASGGAPGNVSPSPDGGGATDRNGEAQRHGSGRQPGDATPPLRSSLGLGSSSSGGIGSGPSGTHHPVPPPGQHGGPSGRQDHYPAEAGVPSAAVDPEVLRRAEALLERIVDRTEGMLLEPLEALYASLCAGIVEMRAGGRAALDGGGSDSGGRAAVEQIIEDVLQRH